MLKFAALLPLRVLYHDLKLKRGDIDMEITRYLANTLSMMK